MHFEFRLQGGGKFFAFGLGWLEVIGESGFAHVRGAPGFCHGPDLSQYFSETAQLSWMIWRDGDAARRYLLDKKSLCAALSVGPDTLGAGFVSIDGTTRRATVDICLSVTQTTADGASIFDDWNRILNDKKDDLNTEILLRLNLDDAVMRDFDLDGFKDGKRLGATDIELEVRPSAIQFSLDDD